MSAFWAPSPIGRKRGHKRVCATGESDEVALIRAEYGDMAELMEMPTDVFANPVWHALQTKHRRFAISAGEAYRYPGDVAPFAAMAAPSHQAMLQLRSLLLPGESVWLVGENHPPIAGVSFDGTLACLQMMLPEEVKPPHAEEETVLLHDAEEMVALTDLAFPGFFRSRTCEMGSYFGVRRGTELVAMGGERLMLEGYSEISGLCTRPAHRGKGLAANIIWRLVRKHREVGSITYLHVGCANERAIALYKGLGFSGDRQRDASADLPD
jgi:ribosomal protein S18 acetylase RimI-like enzyme